MRRTLLWRALAASLVTASLLLAATNPAQAATPCWERVLADWSADTRIDRSYPLQCYHQTVAHLPTDLRTYSSAEEDITAALHRRVTASRRTRGATAISDRSASGSNGPLVAISAALTVVAAIATLRVLAGLRGVRRRRAAQTRSPDSART